MCAKRLRTGRDPQTLKTSPAVTKRCAGYPVYPTRTPHSNSESALMARRRENQQRNAVAESIGFPAAIRRWWQLHSRGAAPKISSAMTPAAGRKGGPKLATTISRRPRRCRTRQPKQNRARAVWQTRAWRGLRDVARRTSDEAGTEASANEKRLGRVTGCEPARLLPRNLPTLQHHQVQLPKSLMQFAAEKR